MQVQDDTNLRRFDSVHALLSISQRSRFAVCILAQPTNQTRIHAGSKFESKIISIQIRQKDCHCGQPGGCDQCGQKNWAFVTFYDALGMNECLSTTIHVQLDKADDGELAFAGKQGFCTLVMKEANVKQQKAKADQGLKKAGALDKMWSRQANKVV
eukprot:SAG22_NODE_581_length_8895_cov_2.587767_6_plen_156_part_00